MTFMKEEYTCFRKKSTYKWVFYQKKWKFFTPFGFN